MKKVNRGEIVIIKPMFKHEIFNRLQSESHNNAYRVRNIKDSFY